MTWVSITRNLSERYLSGQRQAGVILLLALVFLIVLGVLASTLLQSSALEMRMAGNLRVKETLRQQALAIARAVVSDARNFDVGAEPGYVRCLVGGTLPGCDMADIHVWPVVAEQPFAPVVDVRIRGESADALLVPPREAEAVASSALRDRFAVFDVDVRVAGVANNHGEAGITRGVAVRVMSQGGPIDEQ